MKPSIIKSDSRGVSETSSFSLKKRQANILSRKRSLARRTNLNLGMMILAVCTVLALFANGLPGGVWTQEIEPHPHLVSQAIADANDPLSGAWVLNPSKSKMPSQPSILKSLTAHMVVHASHIEITQEGIFESGEQLKIQVKARFDGKDYPIAGAPGPFSAAFQRVEKDIIKAVVKMDGQVIVQETGIISPDGQTLAVIYYFLGATGNATGKEAAVIAVFEKK